MKRPSMINVVETAATADAVRTELLSVLEIIAALPVLTDEVPDDPVGTETITTDKVFVCDPPVEAIVAPFNIATGVEWRDVLRGDPEDIAAYNQFRDAYNAQLDTFAALVDSELPRSFRVFAAFTRGVTLSVPFGKKRTPGYEGKKRLYNDRSTWRPGTADAELRIDVEARMGALYDQSRAQMEAARAAGNYPRGLEALITAEFRDLPLDANPCDEAFVTALVPVEVPGAWNEFASAASLVAKLLDSARRTMHEMVFAQLDSLSEWEETFQPFHRGTQTNNRGQV